MDFRGKVALITGSSRGIGASIAKAFANEGAAIAINYVKNESAALDTVENCENVGGIASSFKADVTNPEEARLLVESVQSEFGKIDILVNNAFRSYDFDPEQRKMFWDLNWDHYQSQLEGSLLSTHTLCKAVLPLMQRRAKGSIINIPVLKIKNSLPMHLSIQKHTYIFITFNPTACISVSIKPYIGAIAIITITVLTTRIAIKRNQKKDQ